MNITNIQIEDPSYTNILYDCKANLDCDFIYADEPGFLEYFESFNLHEEISKELVIIGSRDVWLHNSKISNEIELACKKNPSSTFILFHVYFDSSRMPKALQECKNLHFIHVSQIIDGKEEFKNTQAVTNKNFGSEKIGLALNRKNRHHRVVALGMIHALNLEPYIVYTGNGIIKNVCSSDLPIIQQINWDFNSIDISAGFDALCNHLELAPGWPNSYRKSISRYNNFDEILRPYYKQSFVEIISETTFNNINDHNSIETTGTVTEKYLQSIYGYNFPILIGGVGTVKYLREFVGVDVFDDVVDHSYDTIIDPTERILRAITKNKHLFIDTERTKELWKQCKPRFDANLKLAREDMQNIYYNHAISEFKKLMPRGPGPSSPPKPTSGVQLIWRGAKQC